MYVVTNRNVIEGESGFAKFGKQPNAEGPNELRLVKVEKRGRGWSVKIMKETGGPPPSAQAARVIIDAAKETKKNVLFFVHGFNNDIRAVVERAHDFERNFGVQVVPFSWPANGSKASMLSKAKGLASYKSDKADALASLVALNRVFEKARDYLRAETRKSFADIKRDAARTHPDNLEARDRLITECCERACPFKVSLVLHSMGNYLFKHLLQSSIFTGVDMLFDNVILVAADANNEGHASWVDKIECRNRVYVTINEDDHALRAARLKIGDTQKARLGHYPHNLNSRQALYVDFTNVDRVDSSHAYFEGAVLRNRKIKDFFKKAFHGQRAEGDLKYDPSTNMHKFPAPRRR